MGAASEPDATSLPAADMQRMQEMLDGFRVTQLLHVAARLGLADALADGPKKIDALALATGANADALYRTMRTLASLGVFEEVEEQRFALTPLAELLQENHPYSVRGQAIFFGTYRYRAWGGLLDGVTSGETPFEHIFGMGLFAYLAQHPEESASFNQSMTESSRRAAAAIVGAYDFSSARTVVDIGGGQGMLIAAVLRANPSLRGILFDEEHVVAGALPLLEDAGVADRCERVAGDFFTTAPAGADTYMMRHILHDWDDERCIAILRTCAQAMAPDGKVLVIDFVIEPGNDPSPAKNMDMMMFVMTGGRERTAAQFGALFTAAGLRLTRIISTAAESLIEGERAERM